MLQDMLGQIIRKLVQLPDATLGTVYDLLEKLAGPNGSMWLKVLKNMLRGEQPWSVLPPFEVTTKGRSGKQFITDLEQKGFCLGESSKELLLSKQFITTDGVTYKLVIIMGDDFEDSGRTSQNIRKVAYARNYLDPPLEVAPYLREIISDEDLEKIGLWLLIVMHKPIVVSGDALGLLGIDRRINGRWLGAFNGSHDLNWGRGCGFVFLVPANS